MTAAQARAAAGGGALAASAAVRGVNGKGKTTLLRLLASALAPSRGTIKLAGLDSAGDTPELPWLTVQEFLDLHMALSPAADVQLLNAQLAAFGVMDTLPQAGSCSPAILIQTFR